MTSVVTDSDSFGFSVSSDADAIAAADDDDTAADDDDDTAADDDDDTAADDDDDTADDTDAVVVSGSRSGFFGSVPIRISFEPTVTSSSITTSASGSSPFTLVATSATGSTWSPLTWISSSA